jgi:hypothetical protein
VSPDGTQLALTVNSREPGMFGIPDKIVIINLKTGAQSAWQGGLDRPGQAFNIVNLSWADGGRSLVFLAQWCDFLDTGRGLTTPPSARARTRRTDIAMPRSGR